MNKADQTVREGTDYLEKMIEQNPELEDVGTAYLFEVNRMIDERIADLTPEQIKEALRQYVISGAREEHSEEYFLSHESDIFHGRNGFDDLMDDFIRVMKRKPEDE